MLTFSTDLAAAVETAYEIFPERKLGPRLHVCSCPCCVNERDERHLIATPRRQICAGLIREYTNSAHGYLEATVGPELRHFLPRMFELAAEGEAIAINGLEVAFSRLGPGRDGLTQADYRRNWRPQEIGAVDGFFAAFFRARLALPPEPSQRIDAGQRLFQSDDTMEPMLCALAQAGADLTRMLALWDGDPSPAATWHIAALVNGVASRDWGCALESGRLLNPFWSHWGAAEKLVVDWLARSTQIERLMSAIEVEKDPVIFAVFVEAQDCLLRLQRRSGHGERGGFAATLSSVAKGATVRATQSP